MLIFLVERRTMSADKKILKQKKKKMEICKKWNEISCEVYKIFKRFFIQSYFCYKTLRNGVCKRCETFVMFVLRKGNTF